MKALKPWLVILLVFVAGFAGGVAVTRAKIRSFIQQSISHPETVRDRMEERMVSRLKLDAGQRREVHRILVERQTQIHDLRMEFTPQFFAITTAAESDISKLLTPQQQQQFDKMLEQRHRMMAPLKH